jgi:type III pantothenate kinase
VRGYEPFGLINLEAMACEAPVVASGVGGMLEVVEDGVTGILVPPAEPATLAAALTRVLADRSLAQAMGRAGRRRVEERFAWASVAERTEQLYAAAIADFRGRNPGD